MALLRTVKLVIFEVFYLIGTLFRRPEYNRRMRAGDRRGAVGVVEDVALRWSIATLRASGGRVEIEGRENLPADGRPVVYVSNHQSLFDPPLIVSAIGAHHFIAKDGVKKIPIVYGWLKRWGCILVDRADARAAAASLREGAKLLEEGYSLVVFAEGTRSRTDDLLPFKAGSFRIAQHAKAPVVPCCIQGTGAFLEQSGYRLRRGAVLRVRILPMIDTEGYTREDWKALPALCEAQIAAAHAELRALPADGADS